MKRADAGRARETTMVTIGFFNQPPFLRVDVSRPSSHSLHNTTEDLPREKLKSSSMWRIPVFYF